MRARRKGVGPVGSVAEMGRGGVFSSDADLADFLSHVYAGRDTALF